jgi:hypothetical protein
MPWNQNLSDFNSSASTEEEERTAETTPRAWWLVNEDKTQYRREPDTRVRWPKLKCAIGFNETLEYLHDYLIREGPFDGVMGFSQGGCMAAILAALLEKPGYSSHFPAEPPIPKFKCELLYCVSLRA